MLTHKHLELNRSTVISKFRKFIPDVYIKNPQVLILEDVGKAIGSYDLSDLIFLFNSDGEVLLISERVHKSEHKFFKWWIYLFSAIRKYNKSSKAIPELSTSFSISEDYFEVTYCRESWYKCIEELL